MITTQPVVFEIGNALAKARHRALAIALLEDLREDPQVEVLDVSDSLFESAFGLYRVRPDKNWSLTDCVSFVVMDECGIANALTADDHFRQAGFRPLLGRPGG